MIYDYGEINWAGCLIIKKAGEMKAQKCPRESGVHCSDICPLFGEPDDRGAYTTLRICEDRLLTFKNFVDKRGKG